MNEITIILGNKTLIDGQYFFYLGVAAASALDSIFSKSVREATVASILDDRVVKEHSQLDVLQTTSVS